MVLLTITPNIVNALKVLRGYDAGLTVPDEPSLENPAVGKPITHTQVIAISKCLREDRDRLGEEGKDVSTSYHLDDLLRGSKVYIEPPKPKKEQVA